jgi:hypothetical protein
MPHAFGVSKRMNEHGELAVHAADLGAPDVPRTLFVQVRDDAETDDPHEGRR